MSTLMAATKLKLHLQMYIDHGTINVNDATQQHIFSTYTFGLRLHMLVRSQVGSLCAA